jgi:hypothetical protein
MKMNVNVSLDFELAEGVTVEEFLDDLQVAINEQCGSSEFGDLNSFEFEPKTNWGQLKPLTVEECRELIRNLPDQNPMS